MQTLNIHQVQSVTLSEASHYEAEINREAFSVRRLEVTDISGNKISIELYANDPKALTINADWNDGQSIIV